MRITFVIAPFTSSFSIMPGRYFCKSVLRGKTGIPCSGIQAQRVTWKLTKTMTRPPHANSWKNLERTRGWIALVSCRRRKKPVRNSSWFIAEKATGHLPFHAKKSAQSSFFRLKSWRDGWQISPRILRPDFSNAGIYSTPFRLSSRFVVAAAVSAAEIEVLAPPATEPATAWHAPLLENHFSPTNSGGGKFQLFHLAE